MAYTYLLTEDAITVLIDGKPVSKPVSAFDEETMRQLLTAIEAEDKEVVEKFMYPVKMVQKYVRGHVTVRDGEVFYKDRAIHNALTERILQFMQNNLPIEPLVAFLDNVMQNPSYRAVNELYRFLEYNKMPITPHGTFMAYKRIRHDWKDIHTGTIDNSIGRRVSVPRNAVDEDSTRTCSSGLHVCAYGYLIHYGSAYQETDRVVLVEVNPRDVVAVPQDYDNAKMRVCEYFVKAEVEDWEGHDILKNQLLYEDEDFDELVEEDFLGDDTEEVA